VQGSFTYMHKDYTNKLSFWLGWNVGIADGAVNSIDLANVITDNVVQVTMESFHFGVDESKFNQFINTPPVLGGSKDIGYASGTSGGQASEVEDEQEKQGVVGQLSQAGEKTEVVTMGKPVILDTEEEESGYKEGIVQVRKPNENNSDKVFVTTAKGIGSEETESNPATLDYPLEPFRAIVDQEVEPGDTVGTEEDEPTFMLGKDGFKVLVYYGTEGEGEDEEYIALIVRMGDFPRLYESTDVTASVVTVQGVDLDGTLDTKDRTYDEGPA